MNDSNNEVLLIFVKNPEAGKVKTRLAESIGDQPALEVYHALLDMTRRVADKLSCDRQVWYSEHIEEDDRWDEGRYEKRLQSGSGLGERMRRAFARAFEEGYRRAVIIGSDCADLSSAHIEQAFSALKQKNIAIGPSEDGGYYLLGMNKCRDGLFEGINWSTSEVFQQTMSRIEEQNLSCHRLPVLNDIDTESDLKASDKKLR